MLKFKCPLLAVTNMDQSIKFYEEVIGDRVAMNFGENVTFEGGFSLQEMKRWQSMIHTDDVHLKNNAAELYFEEDDFDGFLKYLLVFPELQYVLGIHEEEMDVVIKRMLKSGMTVEQVSEKSQYPIEYVKRFV